MKKQRTRKRSKKIRGGGCGTSKSQCKQPTVEEVLANDLRQSSRGNSNRKLPKFYSTNEPPKTTILPNDSSFPVNSPNSISRKKTIKRNSRI
jgi:hypothetical protein